jgi:hypothetical protein
MYPACVPNLGTFYHVPKIGAMRKSVHTGEYAVLRERLTAVREKAGISQRELGRRMGVPHTWVAKVESGERRIDLVEFGWFCAGCGVEAGEVARELLKTLTPALSRGTGRGGKRSRSGRGGGK